MFFQSSSMSFLQSSWRAEYVCRHPSFIRRNSAICYCRMFFRSSSMSFTQSVWRAEFECRHPSFVPQNPTTRPLIRQWPLRRQQGRGRRHHPLNAKVNGPEPSSRSLQFLRVKALNYKLKVRYTISRYYSPDNPLSLKLTSGNLVVPSLAPLPRRPLNPSRDANDPRRSRSRLGSEVSEPPI
jgi:hypothetical protein